MASFCQRFFLDQSTHYADIEVFLCLDLSVFSTDVSSLPRINLTLKLKVSN